MADTSAGLLLYRREASHLEVLLVHPGGPFWACRDLGAWSVPKGIIGSSEDPLDAARREFEEELGIAPPASGYIELGEVVQRAGKRVIAFACEGDFDPALVLSNTFEIEWPPGSGRRKTFPEVDRAEWFASEVAATKLIPGQVPLLARLLEYLSAR